MKVLLLNNVPAPYFTPLFEKLGETENWELTVCYASGWNSDVGWENAIRSNSATHTTIILNEPSSTPDVWVRYSWNASFRLLRFLIDHQPDYIICYGYTLRPQIMAIMWAAITRTPFAVIGDANYFIDSVTGLKRFLKTLWLRNVVQRAAAVMAIGTASRRFWESYGGQTEKIFETPFAVDNTFFAKSSCDREADASELRHQLGLADSVVFLFVGRLVKRKNVDLVIQAAQQLHEKRVSVVIAGSGEEQAALKKIAAGDPHIIFTGNIKPADLPLYYAMADVLVLPAGKEPWGLVINEAMACGLAVIAHKHCGAAVDLVDEKNGVKLEDFSANEIARAMHYLASDGEILRSKQKCSREKIKGWSIDAAAQGIVRAVEASYLKR